MVCPLSSSSNRLSVTATVQYVFWQTSIDGVTWSPSNRVDNAHLTVVTFLDVVPVPFNMPRPSSGSGLFLFFAHAGNSTVNRGTLWFSQYNISSSTWLPARFVTRGPPVDYTYIGYALTGLTLFSPRSGDNVINLLFGDNSTTALGYSISLVIASTNGEVVLSYDIINPITTTTGQQFPGFTSSVGCYYSPSSGNGTFVIVIDGVFTVVTSPNASVTYENTWTVYTPASCASIDTSSGYQSGMFSIGGGCTEFQFISHYNKNTGVILYDVVASDLAAQGWLGDYSARVSSITVPSVIVFNNTILLFYLNANSNVEFIAAKI